MASSINLKLSDKLKDKLPLLEFYAEKPNNDINTLLQASGIDVDMIASIKVRNNKEKINYDNVTFVIDLKDSIGFTNLTIDRRQEKQKDFDIRGTINDISFWYKIKYNKFLNVGKYCIRIEKDCLGICIRSYDNDPRLYTLYTYRPEPPMDFVPDIETGEYILQRVPGIVRVIDPENYTCRMNLDNIKDIIQRFMNNPEEGYNFVREKIVEGLSSNGDKHWYRKAI